MKHCENYQVYCIENPCSLHISYFRFRKKGKTNRYAGQALVAESKVRFSVHIVKTTVYSINQPSLIVFVPLRSEASLVCESWYYDTGGCPLNKAGLDKDRIQKGLRYITEYAKIISSGKRLKPAGQCSCLIAEQGIQLNNRNMLLK
jgi:hypothetical protein